MAQPILTAGPIARDRNGVIGRGGDLPWKLKTDLANFRAVTMGKPVIMGRKTWDSLPRKPLVGRMNLVLSRDGSFEPKGAVVCEEFTEAVAIGREQAAVAIHQPGSLFGTGRQQRHQAGLEDRQDAPAEFAGGLGIESHGHSHG